MRREQRSGSLEKADCRLGQKMKDHRKCDLEVWDVA